ncbi:MAG: decarboxylating 6-phosphogluconate dehydrogenase, partial [Streptococcaceae bacterium]|nr:decarboxylating 6-phosphogluconate dehydrogenase [Streptococcaceae bacterium]
MKFGMIGLGKMGLNLTKNAIDHGNEVLVFDLNSAAVEEAMSYSARVTALDNFDDLVDNLDGPRVIWLMLPAGKPTIETISILSEKLAVGDIVIDGGNSNYKDDLQQYEVLKEKGIHYFDVGTSGGMEGARRAGNFMIGGDAETWPVIEPLFKDLSENGAYLYTGPVGSGHYLKMVHNGIEYGMMQAIAEGFEILDAGPYDYDFPEVAQLWNHGSVIRSWLMELAGEAFAKDPKLEQIASRMYSSGEGK